MPFCSNCGEEYQIEQKTCASCNKELQNSNSVEMKNITDMPGTTDHFDSPKSLRISAGIIDILVVFGLYFLLLSAGARVMMMVGIKRVIAVAIPVIYMLLKDCIEGKSIGKLLTGLTVFNTVEKRPSGMLDSIIRNWYLGIPLIGPTILSLVAAIQILVKNRRWGDGMAHTIVVKDCDLEGL